MRRLACLGVLFTALAIGCGGGDQPGSDGGLDAGRSDGGCDGASCTPATCGNGIVEGAEPCDDGNEVAFDGCEEDCTFTCADDALCEDGNPCDGDDTCNLETHRCDHGEAPATGSACPLGDAGFGVCNADAEPICVEARCGNGVVDGTEECDDGMNGDDDDGCKDDCSFTCHGVDECTDEDVCTGDDACDLTTHTCSSTDPLACTASDACHSPSCDPAGGCTESLIDADGDGHAPMALGACGDDCHDDDPTAYFGAEELCDLHDNNCDGVVDEVAPTWYVDCDGDGYALNTDSSRVSCTAPPASATGCSGTGAWVSRRPAGVSDTDCNDADPSINPGVIEIVGDEFDQNCDGAEVCFVDSDHDGFRRADGLTTMSADADCDDAPEAAASTPATDCNDDVGTIRPSAAELPGDDVDQDCNGTELCFHDMDDDGVRTTMTFTSSDADCDDSGEAVAGDASGDCCDTDRNARPGITAFHTSANACRSFDYDCSGAEERRYGTGSCGTPNGTCSNERDGFIGTPPACGASGTYLTACTPEIDPELHRTFCFPDGTETRTQSCR